MIKAVVFDIDGTLSSGVSWLKITEQLGASVSEHERIFDLFSKHKLTYFDAKQQLIRLWQDTDNANKPFLTSLFKSWELEPDAHQLADYLNEVQIRTTIITGSVDLFAQEIASKLNVQSFYANTELIWDDKGQLVDFHYERDQEAKKLVQFNDFLDKNSIRANDCIVLGDSENDVELFKLSGKGIAVKDAEPGLIAVSWKQVEKLTEVIGILKSYSR